MFRLKVKDFSASPAQPARRLEGHKKVGGDTARAADPNWPKGCSIPWDVMPSIETGGSWPGGDRCSGTNRASVGK